MKVTLSIVGGGASALALIDQITQQLQGLSYNEIIIYVIEKNHFLGPGNAYSLDTDSNILNTKAGYITAFKDKPGDFFQWLNENPAKWEKYFPNLQIDEHTYAPRSLFGIYMRESFSKVTKHALAKNIIIVPVQAEVVDIFSSIDIKKQTLITDCGLQIISDYTVLACGTLSKNSSSSNGHSNIYSNPYPINVLKSSIKTDSSVSIIGSRLSAIDAVIGLIEGGHQGKIYMHSRSGLFPSVRGTQGRYKNKFLDNNYIKSNYKELTLAELTTLFYRELEYYRAYHVDTKEVFDYPPSPISNLSSFLEKEISLAEGPRGWQAVLYGTNAILATVWKMLNHSDKETFFNLFLPSSLAFRVSIPQENAKKILAYSNSGQLEFIAGPTKIVSENNEHTVFVKGGKKYNTNNVIYATGSPRNLRHSNSKLIHKLLDKEMVLANKFGGIEVSVDSYNIISADNSKNDSIYAIGEITNGNFLFTSALDIIVNHASLCATQLVREFKKNQDVLSSTISLEKVS